MHQDETTPVAGLSLSVTLLSQKRIPLSLALSLITPPPPIQLSVAPATGCLASIHLLEDPVSATLCGQESALPATTF